MRRLATALLLTVVSMLWIVVAQNPGPPPLGPAPPQMKREQMEALLKEEHKKSLEDAADLVKLSEELKIELEKNDRHVLSVTAMKKTEEIEKIAKRIRGRMRRF
jgi:hypothetical protein